MAGPGRCSFRSASWGTRYQELDPEQRSVVVCEHGIRSAAARRWLLQVGFRECANMRSGMSAWRGSVE